MGKPIVLLSDVQYLLEGIQTELKQVQSILSPAQNFLNISSNDARCLLDYSSSLIQRLEILNGVIREKFSPGSGRMPANYLGKISVSTKG